MRVLAILAIAGATIGATDKAPPPTQTSSPPASLDRLLSSCHKGLASTGDRTSAPELDRRPATPDDGLLVFAVDRTEGGCKVLVPVRDPANPVPAPEARFIRTIPATVQN